MNLPLALPLGRTHRARLMQLWRSAGWPCRDVIELDLLAAGLLEQIHAPTGHDTLRLTAAGLQWLAQARRGSQRAAGLHDRLAARVAGQLLRTGRVVWRELSLRARVEPPAPEAMGVQEQAQVPLPSAGFWRMARPDVFSVRNTSVEAYLQPSVHEIKVSRADLLSDLRHEAKRQAYRWLCSECYYVFPAGVADPAEIPAEFGVWLLHGDVDDGRLEMVRPARHTACTLPFPVWLALAKATPMVDDQDPPQPMLDTPP